jgi:threonine aldolase
MSEGARGFASDNFSGAHPDVLAAIAEANEGHAPAYGDDRWTARAADLFREHFGDDARAFPVPTGTGANVLCLRAALRPMDAVICPETAHLHVDECGAPEAIAGVKLLTVPTPDGKLTPELVEPRITRIGDEHAVQPRLVSISQASELGTVYTAEDVAALAELCHEGNLLLHLDGARLANAAAGLDAPLRALTTDSGVDLLSFGATTNGAISAEAVVLLRPHLAEGFPYLRKQTTQLASKMRFVSAQLIALLSDDLWRRNAAHANAMATRLADAVSGIPDVSITQPVQSNAVFATLPAGAAKRLRNLLEADPPFHVWNESTGELRWMCSWDTTRDDVDNFAAAVRGGAMGPG